MGGHQTRTGVLAWNSRILASGSRDRNILQHDLRVPDNYISKLVGHKSEVWRLQKYLNDVLGNMQTKLTFLRISIIQVCGLKWSNDDRELASGGNDNQVAITNLCLFFSTFVFSSLALLCFSQWLTYLVACGEQLLVWNQQSQQPALRLTEHTAAVKAIAWSPHQSGLLASGGGTADRCIRFWNTTNGHQLNSIDTGSQVDFCFCLCVWE